MGGGARRREGVAVVSAPPAAPRTGRRLHELDVLRAVAAVAVIVIHVTASLIANPAGSRSFWWAALLNQGARFSIGAFVLISGVALYHAYGDRTEFSLAAYYRRRCRVVLLPYVAWSAVYVLMVAWVSRQWTGLPARFLGDLLSGNAMYHLYFLVLILQFYLLFPLVRTLSRRPWFGAAAAAAVAAQIALDALSFYHTGPWPSAVLRGVFHYSDRLFPWWMGYFAAGGWAAAHLEQLRAAAARYRGALAVASAAVLVWMVVELALYVHSTPPHSVGWAASEFRPSAVVYTLLASAAILCAAHRGLPAMRLWLETGRCSFGVYLAHPLVLAEAAAHAIPLHLRPEAYFVAVFPITLLGAYLITRVLERLPGLSWTVGLAAAARA